MSEELRCKVCGKLASEDSHFYPRMMLCNRHYIQMYRHGETIEHERHSKLKHKCDICGDTTSKRYTVWSGEGEYKDYEMCTKHYGQMIKTGKLLDAMPSAKNVERKCCVCGDTNKVIYSKMYNGMYCQRHYSQLYNLGELKDKTVFDRNEYYIEDDVAHIILRDGKNNDIAETIVDAEDVEKLLVYKWRLGTWGYAESKAGMMQRVVLNNNDKSVIIDHINRNPLDNRKANLREVDKSYNAVNCDLRVNNKSGVTGVSWNKNLSLWRAYINYKGKRIELGYFIDLNDAIIARLNAENEYYPNMQPQKDIFEKYGVEVL